MSLVVLNAPEGGTYNSWLTWGDGICAPQADDIRVGSNAVSLSATEAIVIIEEVVENIEVVAEITPVPVTTTSAPVTTAAQTSDAEYIMFISLALISILSGLLIVKKAKR